MNDACQAMIENTVQPPRRPVAPLYLQVREPFQPRQPCGVNAASVRAHGGAGGVQQLCVVQVVQGEAVAAVHPAHGALVPVAVLHRVLAAEPHVFEISLDAGDGTTPPNYRNVFSSSMDDAAVCSCGLVRLLARQYWCTVQTVPVLRPDTLMLKNY